MIRMVAGLIILAVIAAVIGLVIPVQVGAAREADTLVIKGWPLKVHEGPGWYYRLTEIAGSGERVEVLGTEEGWTKVRTASGGAGYASAFSIEEARKDTTSWNRPRGSVRLAAATRVSGVRGVTDPGGFASVYADDKKIDPGLLVPYLEVPFTPEEYGSFRASLVRRSLPIPALSEGGITDTEKEIGAAVALRILDASPPVNDPPLWKYVSMVGTALAERTQAYDEEFVFIVLADEEPASFSAPGGFVFITAGALKLMESEAELAGVLAHEVVHVANRHGIRDIDIERIRGGAREKQGELDREVQARGMDAGLDRRLVADLTAIADKLYEQITAGRNMADEDEADSVGTMLLYRTGYDRAGLKGYLMRAGDRKRPAAGAPTAYRPANERAKRIDGVIRDGEMTVGPAGTMVERFKEYKKSFSP